MKVYTRTGDVGTSSLYDGKRIAKNTIIFDVLGELDELSCRIGMLCVVIPITSSLEKAVIDRDSLVRCLRRFQSTIQDINSIIATTDKEGKTLPEITEQDVLRVEEWIDIMDNYNPKLTKFILPGVRQEDSQAQLCRTQTRRVERYLWELHDTDGKLKVYNKDKEPIDLSPITIPENVTKYMNRLSDFFFVLSRYLCSVHGVEDCFYDK